MTTYNTGNPPGSQDPRDLFDNSGNLDQFMLSPERTYSDRLGVERLTLTALENATPDAIAARDGANSAAEVAVLARDASIAAAGPLYATEAIGRAAVADGETFNVQGSGDIAAYQYRRVNSTTSTLLSTYPASSAVQKTSDALSVERYGAGYSDALPIPVGTSNASGLILLDWPQIAGRISKMYINSAAAGTVDVYVYSKAGDTFTLQRQQTLTIPAAGYQILPVSMPIAAGEYIAVRGSGGSLTYSAGRSDGNGIRSGTVGPSFTQATVSTTSRMMVRVEVSAFTGFDQATPQIEGSLDHVIRQTLTETRDQQINNLAPFAAPTGSLSATATFILKTPADDNGDLIFECNATAAGVVKLLLMTKISETRFEQSAVEAVTVVVGTNSIPLTMKAKKGDYFAIRGAAVGYRSETSLGTASFFTQNFADGVAWTYTVNIMAGFKVRSAVAPAPGALDRPSVVDLPWEYMLLPVLGHSLMEGSQTPTSGTIPITTTQEFDNLAFPAYPAAPSSLLPANVANSQRNDWTPRGEWPGLGAAAALRRALEIQNNLRYTDVKSTIVVANNGFGGAKIAGIAKGTAQYNSVIAQAAALAGVSGGTAGVLAVPLGIGENDTDAAAYREALPILVKNLDADTRAQTGQTKTVHTVMYQMSTQQRAISLAQLDAARSISLIALACPGYLLSYYDSIHIDSVSERILGAYFAEAIKTVGLDGGKWEPLWPIACNVSGNFVTLTFNKSGLVLDTTLMPAQTNSGFAVSGTMVSGVSVINGNQVRLQCAAAPALGATVSYGVTATGKGPFVGRAGNLRDNRGDSLLFDGFPLHNWCVEFDWVI
ncbi:hypothetical protein [Comamonas thiooxydans]|uniref:hypothetical protein n=1 Tax=Comamonas thiooxydans TaxID=363952 RepID=UPI00050EE5BB|nr:hypothetical protein [Comamonas thiooxydans]KGG82443.1 hypothetical protein P609_19665 [Comamonas thiooxydans]